MINKELLKKGADSFGVELTDVQLEQFDVYAALLADYNTKVNLTSITSPDEIVEKHFTDSLALLKFAQIKQGSRLCDVGTGAGFPGAALCIARPDLKVTLFDSINKKLEFIRLLAKETGITPDIITARAEDAGRNPAYREKFDVATARAVAELNRLSEYCIPLVKKGGIFAPLKAVLSKEEEQRGFGAAANLGCRLKEKYLYSLPGGDSREIIVFEKISDTNAKYPRNSAQISKKPL